jgi:phosphoglycolate phosphatase-like HAD superfamily hydrolase
MPQFGSNTVIPARVRLIMLDCFDTLVEHREWTYHARRGVKDFLDHFARQRGVVLVVVSDADEQAIRAALDQAGLERYFTKIYHAGNASQDLGHSRRRKRLDVPVREAGHQPGDAVFIGDSPADAEAARFHAIPFIRVPRPEDEAFSFSSLISGPSRYNSGDFSALMLQHYADQQRKGEPKP